MKKLEFTFGSFEKLNKAQMKKVIGAGVPNDDPCDDECEIGEGPDFDHCPAGSTCTQFTSTYCTNPNTVNLCVPNAS